MKSATIFEAYSDLEFQNGRVWGQLGCDLHRQKALQLKKFREEIARRIDERDTMHATVDRLQRELAEARAFISTIIDAPGVNND